MTATSASVRFGADGAVKVQSYVRLTGQHLHPLLHLRRPRADPDHPGRPGRRHDHQPRPGRGDRGRRDLRPPAGRGGEPVRGRAGEARRHRPREPRPIPVRLGRAGGVMARSDGGGAAGAGTSGRPWVLSRVHERGDQRMRKVVTGEQVAQIYNRTRSRCPIWRAPVYRTPLGVVLAVKLFRLLAWLVRLIARHPLAASILALLAVTWVEPRLARPRRPGRLGGGGPGGLAVVLAVLVHPLGESPGAGQVAGLVLPAPVGRGHDDRRPGPAVPGPHPAARARQGHRHPVHRPGAGPAGLRAVRGRLRQARGEPGARVRRPAVPGPHRQVRRGAAGVRPPRRPGRPRPRPPDPGTSRT